MATFFDTELTADVNLIHTRVRTDENLDTIVDTVERDVLLRFTIRTGVNTYRVELEGYDDTTPANSNAYLIEALRRTIGKVASHRLLHYDDDDSHMSESMADYSYSRGGNKLDPDWPDSWESELSQFYAETERWIYI